MGTEKVENAENLDAIASLDDEGRVKWRRDWDSRKPWWTVLTTEERDEVSYSTSAEPNFRTWLGVQLTAPFGTGFDRFKTWDRLQKLNRLEWFS